MRPGAKTTKTGSCWGLDTEGRSGGLEIQKDDLHSIQVCSSEGEFTGRVFYSAREFAEWFVREHIRRNINMFYAFTLPYEFGSLASWELLNVQDSKGKRPWQDWADEPMNLFYLTGLSRQKPASKIAVFDIRLFFYQLRYGNYFLSNLKKLGEYLSDYYHADIHKLEPPLGSDFGSRAPTDTEKPEFEKYGIRDAYICAKAAQWAHDNIMTGWLNNCVPITQIYSWGTVAKFYLELPAINEVAWFGGRRQVYLKEWHKEIFWNTFAGRSEAFLTGGGLNDYYNDVSKLYATAMIQSQAMLIKDVVLAKKCNYDSLLGKIAWQKFYEITGSPYGWIKGVFETHDDLWGLPIDMGDNNWYITGKWAGIYNTLDLEASNATVLSIEAVLLPVFSDEPKFAKPLRKFEELAEIVLHKKYKSEIEEYCIKSTLNSATGIIGKSHPTIGDTTNVLAYNLMLGQSHLFMSELFHKYHTREHPISYCDTDSFFWHWPVDGLIRNCEPYPGLPFQLLETVPLAVGCKGAPKALNSVGIFRGKMYCGLTDEGADTCAFSAWKPFPKFFYKIADEKPHETMIERQVSRKFKTRDKEAARLKIGRWYVKRELWNYDKLCQIFRGDRKRNRPDYNSYALWLANKHVASRAWTATEALQQKESISSLKHGRHVGKVKMSLTT